MILLFKENYGKSITKHGDLCVVPWKYNDKTYESCANPEVTQRDLGVPQN